MLQELKNMCWMQMQSYSLLGKAEEDAVVQEWHEGSWQPSLTAALDVMQNAGCLPGLFWYLAIKCSHLSMETNHQGGD